MRRDKQIRPAVMGPGVYENTTTNACIRGTKYTGSSPTQVVLAHLEDVQKSGTGWCARCPSCGGRRRKVAIHEGEEGQCLVHCFACHDTESIVRAVGLSMHDLFPPRSTSATPVDRRAAQRAMKTSAWTAALSVIAREGTIIDIVANDLHRGRILSDADWHRFELARERIHCALGVLK